MIAAYVNEAKTSMSTRLGGGGRFEVESMPGQGTKVSALIPVSVAAV